MWTVICAVCCPSDKLLHSVATDSPTEEHCDVRNDVGEIGNKYCRCIVVPLKNFTCLICVILYIHKKFNRPGVAGAVLQTPLLLINKMIPFLQTFNTSLHQNRKS